MGGRATCPSAEETVNQHSLTHRQTLQSEVPAQRLRPAVNDHLIVFDSGVCGSPGVVRRSVSGPRRMQEPRVTRILQPSGSADGRFMLNLSCPGKLGINITITERENKEKL